MSLINQVLKDLEKRAKPTPISNMALNGLQSVIAPKFKEDKKYFFVSLMIIFLFVILCIPFLFHKSKKVTPLNHLAISQPTHFSTDAEQSTEASPQAFAPPTDKINPVMLTAATLQILPNTTSLRFLLSENTLYTVKSDSYGQDIIITFDNTHLMAALPGVEYNGSAISHMETSNDTNGNLKVIMTLNPGAQLTKLDLIQGMHSPELQLDFKYTSTLASSQPINAPSQDVPEVTLKKPAQNPSIQQQYDHAMDLSASGSTDTAINQLKTILASTPDYMPARESLANLLIQQNQPAEAEQWIDSSLQLQPTNLTLIQLKARLLVNQGKVNLALNLLQRSAPTIQANPDYYAFIAALYQRLGQVAAATKVYEQLVTLQPTNSKWWLGLGIAYETSGKESQALEAYNRAESSGKLTPELRTYVDSRLHNDMDATT